MKRSMIVIGLLCVIKLFAADHDPAHVIQELYSSAPITEHPGKEEEMANLSASGIRRRTPPKSPSVENLAIPGTDIEKFVPARELLSNYISTSDSSSLRNFLNSKKDIVIETSLLKLAKDKQQEAFSRGKKDVTLMACSALLCGVSTFCFIESLLLFRAVGTLRETIDPIIPNRRSAAQMPPDLLPPLPLPLPPLPLGPLPITPVVKIPSITPILDVPTVINTPLPTVPGITPLLNIPAITDTPLPTVPDIIPVVNIVPSVVPGLVPAITALPPATLSVLTPSLTQPIIAASGAIAGLVLLTHASKELYRDIKDYRKCKIVVGMLSTHQKNQLTSSKKNE